MLNPSLDKLLLATKSLLCLSERHASSPKLALAKARFLKTWEGLSEEQRLAGFGKDERLYKNGVEELKKVFGG